MYENWRNNENICIALGFAFMLLLSLLPLLINQTQSTYGYGTSTLLKNCMVFDIRIQDATTREQTFLFREIYVMSNIKFMLCPT